MNGVLKNGVHKVQDVCYVLKDHISANDVGRAIIEGGQQKQPFYVFDTDEAYHRIRHFKEVMPRIDIFYAMKSNDSTNMLKMAIAMGLGFDCASAGEITKLRKLGVNPLSIVFAVPSKTIYQMTFARDCGVRHTTFDSSYELQKIKQYWPDARLLIRIRVESNSVYDLGEKFGCDFGTEAKDLLDEAANLGLNVAGVAFHVGSACFSKESYVMALTHTRELFDYEEAAGRKMRIVDIGGGFLGYSIDEIDKVANLINNTVDNLFPDPEIQIVAEPGRYICDSTLTLYCSVSNVRMTKMEQETVQMIYINEGIFGSLRCPEKWHKATIFKNSTIKPETDEKYDVILWGPSCHSLDKINMKLRLPKCNPEDWIIFRAHGAYSLTYGSKFSRLERPFTRSVISDNLWKAIKDHPVYDTDDFLVEPDLRTPLPSTIPNVIPPKYADDEYPGSFKLLL